MHKPDEKLEGTESQRKRLGELHELSSHLLRLMEGERAQLAKQLHDELGGMITAAKMDMQWLSSHLGGTLDAKGREKFDSVVQMLDQAMMLKRRVVEDLRPSLLDHFGLAVAMRSHFDENCRRAGMDCVASVPDEPLALDPALQLTIFRVAQEVLSGIVTRGDARNVEVVIEPHEDENGEGYLMTIGDDGDTPQGAGNQLMTSRHRVALAGGQIDVETRPGRGDAPGGNQVRVFVPRSA